MIGLLMGGEARIVPCWQAVTSGQRRAQTANQALVIGAEMRLEWRDRVEAEHALVGVVEQLSQGLALGQWAVKRRALPRRQDQQAMLGHGERSRPARVPAPPIGPGQPDREIALRPTRRIGLQQVEPPSRLQPHPRSLWPHGTPLPSRVSTSFQSSPSGGRSRSLRRHCVAASWLSWAA